MEKKKILLVEDDIMLRVPLRLTLEKQGYEVEEVGDGPTAFERIKAGGNDLVILDNNLPGMNGQDVLKELTAKNIALPHVMVFTNDSSLSTMNDIMQYGVTQYFLKSDMGLAAIIQIVNDYFSGVSE
jgi:DNA-binding response OmpR family regulator